MPRKRAHHKPEEVGDKDLPAAQAEVVSESSLPVAATTPMPSESASPKTALRVKSADRKRKKGKTSHDGADIIPIGISAVVPKKEEAEVSTASVAEEVFPAVPLAETPKIETPKKTRVRRIPKGIIKKIKAPKKAKAKKGHGASEEKIVAIDVETLVKPEHALVKVEPGANLPSPYRFEHRYGKALWYAGVIHIVIGICFAARALSGLYVDGMELSIKEFPRVQIRHMASVVTSDGTDQYPGTAPTTGSPATVNTVMNTSGTGDQNTSTGGGTSGSGSSGSTSGGTGTDANYGDGTQNTSPTNTTNTTGGTPGTEPSVSSTGTTLTSQPTTNDGHTDTNSGTTNTSAGTGETANTPNTTTQAPTQTAVPTTASLTPGITITPGAENPLSGKVQLSVSVLEAEKIELVLQPKGALMMRYIGRPYRTTDGKWRYEWLTTQVPNGEYLLSAYVSNRYGAYRGGERRITISNPILTPSSPSPIVLDSTEKKAVEETIKNIDVELGVQKPAAGVPRNKEPETTAVTGEPKPADPAIAEKSLADMSVTLAPDADPFMALSSDRDVKAKMTSFDAQLDILLERYAVTLRTGDEENIRFLEEQVEKARSEAVETLVARKMIGEGERQEFERQLSEAIQGEQKAVEKREQIIKERVGEKIFTDTDKDGVSDYDETNLYQTDPAAADSDNDGFNDGVEIIRGYDPKDDDREALIAFEDPKSSGSERDDLLKIESVKAEKSAETPEGSTTTPPSVAQFSGKALPNSFVTLYIFSTPVVVTVRTAEDGSWTYTFDKELEDGSHTMYVGITDNAGRIIAKSKPFPFVKTAEAFAAASAAPAAPVTPVYEEPELVSKNIFLLIVSLAVVLAGLSLVALGAYFVQRLEKKVIGEPKEKEEIPVLATL